MVLGHLLDGRGWRRRVWPEQGQPYDPRQLPVTPKLAIYMCDLRGDYAMGDRWMETWIEEVPWSKWTVGG